MRIVLLIALIILSSCATLERDCDLIHGCKFPDQSVLRVYPDCEVDNINNHDMTSFVNDPNPQNFAIIVAECIKVQVEYKFKTDISSVW